MPNPQYKFEIYFKPIKVIKPKDSLVSEDGFFVKYGYLKEFKVNCIKIYKGTGLIGAPLLFRSNEQKRNLTKIDFDTLGYIIEFHRFPEIVQHDCHQEQHMPIFCRVFFNINKGVNVLLFKKFLELAPNQNIVEEIQCRKKVFVKFGHSEFEKDNIPYDEFSIEYRKTKDTAFTQPIFTYFEAFGGKMGSPAVDEIIRLLLMFKKPDSKSILEISIDEVDNSTDISKIENEIQHFEMVDLSEKHEPLEISFQDNQPNYIPEKSGGCLKKKNRKFLSRKRTHLKKKRKRRFRLNSSRKKNKLKQMKISIRRKTIKEKKNK